MSSTPSHPTITLIRTTASSKGETAFVRREFDIVALYFYQFHCENCYNNSPFVPIFTNSGSIADAFDSPTVNGKHVMLSPLGYDAAQGKVPDEVDHIVRSGETTMAPWRYSYTWREWTAPPYPAPYSAAAWSWILNTPMPIIRRVDCSWSLGMRAVGYSDNFKTTL